MEVLPSTIRGLINDLTRTLTGSLVHMDDLLLHLDNDSGEFDDAWLANHQLERALEFFIELRSEYMIREESINKKKTKSYNSTDFENLLHEFNNLLIVVMGYCDMIQNNCADIRDIFNISVYIHRAIQKSPYLLTKSIYHPKQNSSLDKFNLFKRKLKSIKTSSYKRINVDNQVLLIEDDEVVNGLMSTALYNHKYTVASCVKGEQACAIFERNKAVFGLCIVDIELPDIEGPDLVKKFLLQKPNINVLFTSGYNEIKLRENFSLIGPYQILIKPFRLEELVNKVKSIMPRSIDLRASIGLQAGF